MRSVVVIVADQSLGLLTIIA